MVETTTNVPPSLNGVSDNNNNNNSNNGNNGIEKTDGNNPIQTNIMQEDQKRSNKSGTCPIVVGVIKRDTVETTLQREKEEENQTREERKKLKEKMIGQSITAAVEEFENVVSVKSNAKSIKEKGQPCHVSWQELQRSQLPSSPYSHYYYSNTHPQSTSPYLTTGVHFPLTLPPNDTTYPYWKHDILSPSTQTSLNLGANLGMSLGMGMNINRMNMNADMMMLWPYPMENEPDFLGCLSRPAVQGGGIGLCDTDTDSDEELAGAFPVNISFTPSPPTRQEEPITNQNIPTKRVDPLAYLQKSRRVV